MAPKILPDISQLRALLSYDPNTGAFVWKARTEKHFPTGHPWQWKIWNAQYAGKPAGSVQHGYIKIRLGTNFLYAHRLAWLLTYGRPVPDEIDHADGERSNNRITNLRAATRETNSINIRTRQNTATGVKGVNWCAQTGRYRAIIKSNKKRYNLGRFNTLEEAVAARREAAERLHGKFARHD